MPDAHSNAIRQEDARARIRTAVRQLVADGQPVTARALVAAAHASFTTVQKYKADWEPLTRPAPIPAGGPSEEEASAALLAMLQALAPRPLDEYLLGCTPAEVTPSFAAYWHRQMQHIQQCSRTQQLGISALEYRQYAERTNILIAYARQRYGTEALVEAAAALPAPDAMPWPADGRFLGLPMPPALRPDASPTAEP